jgi:hypothetical protein
MAAETTKRRSRRMIIYPLALVCLVVVAIVVVGCLITQPTFHSNTPSAESVEPKRLREHVVALSETFHPRDWRNVGNLDKCAAYIAEHLARDGAETPSTSAHHSDAV